MGTTMVMEFGQFDCGVWNLNVPKLVKYVPAIPKWFWIMFGNVHEWCSFLGGMGGLKWPPKIGHHHLILYVSNKDLSNNTIVFYNDRIISNNEMIFGQIGASKS